MVLHGDWKMKNVKRLVWSFSEKFGLGLFESDKGDYVRYTDYEKLYNMYEQSQKSVEELCERLTRKLEEVTK